MKYTRLGDLLVGNGTITQDQLEEALKKTANAWAIFCGITTLFPKTR